MELGEKILKARQEAGLSQRQVCGDVITRNMLSQIEHGTARPSMKTLQYLSGVFGKPVGYFLGETEESPNGEVMAHARESFLQGKYALVLQTLEDYREPDPVFDAEKGILGFLSCLLGAENAIKEGRGPVKDKFLNQSERFSGPYVIAPLLEYRDVLRGGKKTGEVQNLDDALAEKARQALSAGNTDRAVALLDAVEAPNREWYYLRGSAAMVKGDYPGAEQYLEQGEPKLCLPLLEECSRIQGNFEKAYYYACRRREE